MSEHTEQSLTFDSESSGPRPPASAATTTAAAGPSSSYHRNNSNSNSNINLSNIIGSTNNLSSAKSHTYSPIYNHHNKNGSIANASATADLASSKQPGTSNMSTAALPLSSLSFGRGNSILQYSRKRGGPMTLYVRAASSDDSDTSVLPADTRDDVTSAVAQVNEETPDESAQDESVTSYIFNMLEMGASSIHNLKNVIPDILRHPQKTRFVTEILVFVFFFITFIFLLGVTQERIEWMAKISAYNNEQGLLVSTSLTEELLEKSNELNELKMPIKRTSPDVLEKASMLMKNISDSREISVKLLHSRLLYPGPVEDIKFLLEEHVAYKINLARLVREELEWLDKKKQILIGNRDSPVESQVRLKPKQKSQWYQQKSQKQHKQQDLKQQQQIRQEKRTEQHSKSEVMLQPARKEGMVSSVELFDTGLVNIFVSSLQYRVVAFFILIFLVMLYIRLF
ncbi:uncharacterized protein TM35_000052870 [Trypanosoma theileri]|uniref:Uncharacterized protein n=1 Tax=Trypanosoma theileri TaxID=67003 RepID=A0A1X0P4D0_9TRYP|nr:uncharacterized protein TM35_000052870 [Trypanosoma theileri]ORC91691.1 hypothetical protein TM35_000052870 [Trypanosoma theileri]